MHDHSVDQVDDVYITVTQVAHSQFTCHFFFKVISHIGTIIGRFIIIIVILSQGNEALGAQREELGYVGHEKDGNQDEVDLCNVGLAAMISADEPNDNDRVEEEAVEDARQWEEEVGVGVDVEILVVGRGNSGGEGDQVQDSRNQSIP